MQGAWRFQERRLRKSAAIVLATAIAPVAAAEAQGIAIERIEAIERQIRGLQGELQRLKSELGEAKQQLRQSRGEAQHAHEGRPPPRPLPTGQQEPRSVCPKGDRPSPRRTAGCRLRLAGWCSS